MRSLIKRIQELISFDLGFSIALVFLLLFSLAMLRSIASFLFPHYFLFLVLAILAFTFFVYIDFDILVIFSKHFYILSLVFLLLPLAFGQITRGAIRWIPLGALTLQPSEIVRPFLFLFFATFLAKKEVNIRVLVLSILLLGLPLFLIIIQPSLGVAILTAVGFFGILLSSNIDKRYIIGLILLPIISLPLLWNILAPYQKDRVITFMNPTSDPYGAGYNSIQSMISVGSGKLFGRGLGKGVQTQLAFLPERHTDFIFASVAEELGLLGSVFLLFGLFVLFWRLIVIFEQITNNAARGFIVGLFFTLFFQTIIHVGMNMGLLPITGVPLPLVSAGGSSLLGTMIGLGMVIGIKRSTKG